MSGGPKPLDPAAVKFIVIHCSATSVKTPDIGAEEIERWHRARGFNGIGYHFVIKRDGTVQNGRSLDIPGAHVEGYNSVSIGICLVGGIDTSKLMKPEANFTNQQYDSLRLLLATLQPRFPAAKVQGHRDFPNVAKACPSFDVQHWLKTGRIKA